MGCVESIHITLRFIGEVAEKRVEEIDAALTGLTWKPFTITCVASASSLEPARRAYFGRA
jgi:2'-5' RNA ligase